ncbi:MAG: hypothetical protein ACFB15_15420 [Cyclobacteriaceae bacterium]
MGTISVSTDQIKTAAIANLTFEPFRTAAENPQSVAGKDLVLHLITDDIYLDVKFTSWRQCEEGGLSTRALPSNLFRFSRIDCSVKRWIRFTTEFYAIHSANVSIVSILRFYWISTQSILL